MEEYEFGLLGNGLIAFVVTFVWFCVLYPLIKSRRKSWFFLLLGVAVISTFSIFMEERYQAVPVSLFELFVFFLGIFSAIFFLGFWFWRKHTEFESLPEDISYLKKYGLDTKLKLRVLLQMAIIMEEEAAHFYENLAAKIADTHKKSLCLLLSNEEKQHYKTLHIYFHRWLPIFADHRTIQDLINRFKEVEAFFEVPSLEASEYDIITLALRQEKKFAEFYQSFETAFPRTWKKLKIKVLIDQENGHYEKLQQLLAHYSK